MESSSPNHFRWCDSYAWSFVSYHPFCRTIRAAEPNQAKQGVLCYFGKSENLSVALLARERSTGWSELLGSFGLTSCRQSTAALASSIAANFAIDWKLYLFGWKSMVFGGGETLMTRSNRPKLLCCSYWQERAGACGRIGSSRGWARQRTSWCLREGPSCAWIWRLQVGSSEGHVWWKMEVFCGAGAGLNLLTISVPLDH